MPLTSTRFANNQRLQRAANNAPPLRQGERGEAVALFQQSLIDVGFPLPISTKKLGKPDGIFGNETFTKTRQFQQREHLGVDGVAGKQTLTRLDQLLQTVQTIRVRLVTPAGDAANSPRSSGNGQNEFTFDGRNPGQLEINFKASVIPTSVNLNTIKNSVKFTIENIGNSTKTWDRANPDGRASVQGNFLVARLTFEGLPTNNTDFGRKKVTVEFNGQKQDEATIHIFYSATASNHPGNNSNPNWFHYYKQNERGTDYKYNGAISTSRSSPGIPNSIEIADNAYSGGTYITTKTNASGQLVATGFSKKYQYYQYFIGVLAHERQHANNETTDPTLDTDGDFLPDAFERSTSGTGHGNKYSARGSLIGNQWDDGEVYAGGVIEEQAIKSADISQDWANPGTNFK